MFFGFLQAFYLPCSVTADLQDSVHLIHFFRFCIFPVFSCLYGFILLILLVFSVEREEADRRRAAPSASSRWFNVKTPAIH
jgi:hypothetical protein